MRQPENHIKKNQFKYPQIVWPQDTGVRVPPVLGNFATVFIPLFLPSIP